MGEVTLEVGLTTGPWRVVRVWPSGVQATMMHVYNRRITIWGYREIKAHLKKSGIKLTQKIRNAKP